ncbi:hypothetical protein LguiA_007548 [Lonicera macranthoides]
MDVEDLKCERAWPTKGAETALRDRLRGKGCTTAQLALAWVHHQGNNVLCPILRTTKIKNLE